MKKKRRKALAQCLRLMKKEGILVISYINLIAALYLNLAPALTNIAEILVCYNTRTFGDPFIYMTPDEIDAMAEYYQLKIPHHIASDGNPSMRSADFNKAGKEDFDKYMELPLKICENKNLLGCGLHGLVFLTTK